jgi:hypothetical protein
MILGKGGGWKLQVQALKLGGLHCVGGGWSWGLAFKGSDDFEIERASKLAPVSRH